MFSNMKPNHYLTTCISQNILQSYIFNDIRFLGSAINLNVIIESHLYLMKLYRILYDETFFNMISI